MKHQIQLTPEQVALIKSMSTKVSDKNWFLYSIVVEICGH